MCLTDSVTCWHVFRQPQDVFWKTKQIVQRFGNCWKRANGCFINHSIVSTAQHLGPVVSRLGRMVHMMSVDAVSEVNVNLMSLNLALILWKTSQLQDLISATLVAVMHTYCYVNERFVGAAGCESSATSSWRSPKPCEWWVGRAIQWRFPGQGAWQK